MPKLLDKMENRQAAETTKHQHLIRQRTHTPEARRRTVLPTEHVERLSRTRATMLFTDIPSTGIPLKLRPKCGSKDTMCLPPPSELTKKAENDSTELMTEYEQYLQTLMAEIIIEKKIEERTNSIYSQLASIVHEREKLEERLHTIIKREREIRDLTVINNKLDQILEDGNRESRSLDERNEVLQMLHKFGECLRPLDNLSCKNIIVPTSSLEMQQLSTCLNECDSVLKSITELLGSRGVAYKDMNEHLKDFTQIHDDIISMRRKLEQNLCIMQEHILREASDSLAQDDI